MAKNDFDFILYKILLYYYGALQRKYRFDEKVFMALFDSSIDCEYLMDVIRMANQDGFLEGLTYAKAWGNQFILLNNLSEAGITREGIQFIKNNSGMRKVTEFLKQTPGMAADLAALLSLF